MKRENLNRALELNSVLKSINIAIAQATEFLSTKTKDSFGHSTSGREGLYEFHLSEYRDGSGAGVDLTNCGIGLRVVKFGLEELKVQKEVIEKEIDSL